MRSLCFLALLIVSTCARLITDKPYILGDGINGIKLIYTKHNKAAFVNYFSMDLYSANNPFKPVASFNFSNTKTPYPNKTKTTTVNLTVDFGTMARGSTVPLNIPRYPPLYGLLVAHNSNNGTKIYVTTYYNISFPVTGVTPVPVSKNMFVSTKTHPMIDVKINMSHSINVSDPNNWVVQFVSTSNKNWTTNTMMSVTGVKKNGGQGLYRLTTSFPPKPVYGGLQYLIVGLKMPNTTAFNYYGTFKYPVPYNSYIVYDNSTFNVTVSPSKVVELSYVVTTVKGGGVKDFWWLVAKDTKSKTRYGLQCKARTDSDFTNFEWRVCNNKGNNSLKLPVGTYDIEIYWVPTVNTSFTTAIMDSAHGMVPFKKNGLTVSLHKNKTAVPIMLNGNSGKKLQLFANSTVSIHVYSIFKNITFEWQQEHNNSNNSKHYNETWKTVSGFTKHNLKPGQNNTVSFPVPNLHREHMPVNNTRLYAKVYACDNKTILTHSFIFGNVIIPTPSPSPGPAGKKSKKLGPGAIVGIVCAAVFVCGLASWWLCMKQGGSGTDRYQRLEK